VSIFCLPTTSSSLSNESFVRFGLYHLDCGNNGNKFDYEKTAWTYRLISETQLFETGYAPLGLEGGITKEKAKMTLLGGNWQSEIFQSVVVYPYPAKLVHDDVHFGIPGFLRREGSVPAA